MAEEALEEVVAEEELAAMAVACNEPALVNAINAANAAGGGTLNLAAGCTYTLTVAHGGPGNGLPVITTAITFEGTNTTIRRAPGALLPFRILEVAATGNLTVKAVTLRGGRAPLLANGGGILNSGTLTLTGSTLINNTSGTSGGGIYNDNGTMTFTSSAIRDNSTGLLGNGGAVYNNHGSMTFTSTPIENNFAVLQGGGIFTVDGVVTITTSPVTANQSLLVPGGIYRSGGTMTITASPVTGNTPTNCAGSPAPVPGCIG